MSIACCVCDRPAEVWHPDPQRDGEQAGYCFEHEPEED